MNDKERASIEWDGRAEQIWLAVAALYSNFQTHTAKLLSFSGSFINDPHSLYRTSLFLSVSCYQIVINREYSLTWMG